MIYRIKICENIEKKLKKMQEGDKHKISEKIDSLKDDQFPIDCKKLKGRKPPKLYRVRSGDYRILYTVTHDVRLVIVVGIGHRKEIYT